MNKKTCCFTGHRNIPAAEYPEIQTKLMAKIIELVQGGVHDFHVGGGRGFDTMAALNVLHLKKWHPEIRLVFVFPCKNYTKGWREEDKKIVSLILDWADYVVYTSDEYHENCEQKCDQYLVRRSDICVCYLTKPESGTAETVDYARQEGLEIINIAEI